nr:hypothetical protein [uncultured organism]
MNDRVGTDWVSRCLDMIDDNVSYDVERRVTGLASIEAGEFVEVVG